MFGVMRGALRPDVNVDAQDYLIANNKVLARLSGGSQFDRIDVAEKDWRPGELRALRREGDGPRVLRTRDV